MYPQSRAHGLPEAKTTPAEDELTIKNSNQARNEPTMPRVCKYSMRANGYLGTGNN